MILPHCFLGACLLLALALSIWALELDPVNKVGRGGAIQVWPLPLGAAVGGPNVKKLDLQSLEDRDRHRTVRALAQATQKMQLVKIAIANVAVALTPSEGAENHAVNKALLSQQVTNLLRGGRPWGPGPRPSETSDSLPSHFLVFRFCCLTNRARSARAASERAWCSRTHALSLAKL